MALNQTNKLVWIVETIYRARKISFEELNRRWMDNVDLSGGEEMLKRTFHKWKWNIFRRNLYWLCWRNSYAKVWRFGSFMQRNPVRLSVRTLTSIPFYMTGWNGCSVPGSTSRCSSLTSRKFISAAPTLQVPVSA